MTPDSLRGYGAAKQSMTTAADITPASTTQMTTMRDQQMAYRRHQTAIQQNGYSPVYHSRNPVLASESRSDFINLQKE